MDNANQAQSENPRLKELSDERHEVVTDLQFGASEIRAALAKLDHKGASKHTIRAINDLIDTMDAFDRRVDMLIDELADDSEAEGIERHNAAVAGML